MYVYINKQIYIYIYIYIYICMEAPGGHARRLTVKSAGARSDISTVNV